MRLLGRLHGGRSFEIERELQKTRYYGELSDTVHIDLLTVLVGFPAEKLIAVKSYLLAVVSLELYVSDALVRV